MQTIQPWNLLSGGVFQKSPLAVRNNGSGKISCSFFGNILKFCSPLVCIPIYYQSIGRKATKTHTKICFGATLPLESCLSWWNGQIKATKNTTDCQLMQPVSIEVHHTNPWKKTRWSRDEGVVWSISQVILVCVYLQTHTTADYCSEYRFSDVRVADKLCSLSRTQGIL